MKEIEKACYYELLNNYKKEKSESLSKQFKDDILKRNFNVQLSYFCLDKKGKAKTK